MWCSKQLDCWAKNGDIRVQFLTQPWSTLGDFGLVAISLSYNLSQKVMDQKNGITVHTTTGSQVGGVGWRCNQVNTVKIGLLFKIIQICWQKMNDFRGTTFEALKHLRTGSKPNIGSLLSFVPSSQISWSS